MSTNTPVTPVIIASTIQATGQLDANLLGTLITAINQANVITLLKMLTSVRYRISQLVHYLLAALSLA